MKNQVFALLLFLTVASVAGSDNWPEYRGPNRDGSSDSEMLPLHWSETQNVKWKKPIHGRGWSSPVVWGNQVWLTTAGLDGRALSVLCFDRESGQILLDRRLFDVPKPRPLSNSVNSYATPTPTIEEGRVYVHFGSYGTACLDTESFEPVWKRRDLPCDHWRGPASSPLLWENLIFLHMDGANVQYVAALEKRSGKNHWISFRSTDYADLEEDGRPAASGDWRKAYNTPSIVEFQDQVQLISPSAKAAYAYDARTGEELWQVRHRGHSSAARTLHADGVVGINVGYIGGKAEMWGVRLGGRGDVTETHVLWKYVRGAPKRASPVLIDGQAYMVSNEGVVSCIDFKTGRELWKGRIGGNHSASIVYTANRIYFFSEEGVATIIRPGDRLEILATNQLDSGFMASPAIAGRDFFLRTKTHLYRIEGPGGL